MEAAQWEYRAVRQIQECLDSSTDADELYKSLRLLSVMPITAEIVATSGVRETVKGFRKYQQVGSLAKELAKRWKKLPVLRRKSEALSQVPEQDGGQEPRKDDLGEGEWKGIRKPEAEDMLKSSNVDPFSQRRTSHPQDPGTQVSGPSISVDMVGGGIQMQNAKSVCGVVQQLQERLASSTDTDEILNSLRLLSVIPITAEILATTGVRRVVKSFRKHPQVAALAKELDKHWKTLAVLSHKSEALSQVPDQDGGLEPRKYDLGQREGQKEVEDGEREQEDLLEASNVDLSSQSREIEPLDGGVQVCGSRVSVDIARGSMGTQTAEWVWGAVQLLQEHLASSTHWEDLRKSLSLLSVLPITAEILGATGVREMVKGFRKHPLVGSMAKELDTRWETLALLGCNPLLLSAILQEVSEQDVAQEPRKEALGLSESGWVQEDKLKESSVVWGSGWKERADGRGGPNSGPEPPRPRELCEFQGSGKRSASPCPRSRQEKRPRLDPESSGGSSRSHLWAVDSSGVSRDSGPTDIRDMPGNACCPVPQSQDPPGLPQECLPWEPQGQAGARPKDGCRSSEEGKRGSGPLPSKVKQTSGKPEMQAAKLRGRNHQSKSQQQHEFWAPPQSFEDALNQTQLLPRRQRTKGRIRAAALAQGGLKRNGSSGPRRPSDSMHSSVPRASEVQENQAGQLAPISAANPASPVNSTEAVRVPMVQLSTETSNFPGLQAFSGRLPDLKRMSSLSSSRPGASVPWEVGKAEREGEGGGVEEGVKGDEREGGRGAKGKGGEGGEEMALPFVRKSLKMPLYSGPKRDSLAPWCPQDVRGLPQHSTPATPRPPCILLAPISQTSTSSPHLPQGNTHPRTVAHSGTDRLWQIRCCKAFKDEKPAEGESWRELYLRLHQDQEQRMQAARACTSQEEPRPMGTKLLNQPPEKPPGPGKSSRARTVLEGCSRAILTASEGLEK